MKRLFILPTEHISRKHHAWVEILKEFDWKWEDLVCDLITPLLDEISRHGVNTLIDGDPLDPTYLGEVVYEVLADLLTGGEYKETDPYPPEAFRDDYAAMFAELMVIGTDLLKEVKNYAQRALERVVENHFASAIMYERMVGGDLVLAVEYTPYQKQT